MKNQGKDIATFIITVITGGLLLLPIFLFYPDAVITITSRLPQDQQDTAMILSVVLLIFIYICITSWIATGNPPIVSILFRIICLSGITLGVSFIIDRNFIATKLKLFEIDFLSKIVSEDVFVYIQNNPLQLIFISLIFGFLSEVTSTIKNKNQIIIENIIDREMVRSSINYEKLYLSKKNNKDSSQLR